VSIDIYSGWTRTGTGGADRVSCRLPGAHIGQTFPRSLPRCTVPRRSSALFFLSISSVSLQRGRSGALLMLTRCPVYSTTGSRVDPPLLSLSHTLSQEHHGLNLPDVQSVWRICLFSISISAWCIAMSTFKQIRTHCSNRYNMKNK